MDWLDFFFGMCVGASICEDEYEDSRRAEIYDDFDEDAYEQFLFEQKLRRNRIYNRPFMS